MLNWLYRWQERRIIRAWQRESAGDREVLEEYFDYEDAGNGVTVMTPKPNAGKEAQEP